MCLVDKICQPKRLVFPRYGCELTNAVVCLVMPYLYIIHTMNVRNSLRYITAIAVHVHKTESNAYCCNKYISMLTLNPLQLLADNLSKQFRFRSGATKWA